MARDPRSFAMALSFWISFLMLAGKVGAYLLTGSAAILSDAAESVIHLAATGFAALSLRYSRQPPDKQHPYGHGKISFFSAGAEGALIFGAAIYIVYEGTRALIVGPDLQRLQWGLLITLALGLINLWLGLHLIRTGRKHDTLILVANGKHVLTDMWTSLGVLVGVFIVWITDIRWIDPVVGIAMGLNIAWSGFGLIRNAMSGLMDEADPETTSRIQKVLTKAKEDSLLEEHHYLRGDWSALERLYCGWRSTCCCRAIFRWRRRTSTSPSSRSGSRTPSRASR